MTTIYISCTTQDLGQLKQTLKAYLDRYNDLDVIVTASDVSDISVMQRCFDDLDKCDVYIGLIGFQYGWVPECATNNPDGLSMTELEFHHALNTNKKLLLFLGTTQDWEMQFNENDPTKKIKLDRFRDSIENNQQHSWHSLMLSKQHEVLLQVIPWLVNNSLIGANDTRKSGLPIDPASKPYIGLQSFSYKNRHLYFGREAEVGDAQKLLKNQCRFLLVTGASGTGKSSLVEAGILPVLHKEKSGDSWFFSFRPADDATKPLMTLAHEIGKRINPRPRPSELLTSWLKDPLNIVQHLDNCSEPLGSIVVDQLEELFTRCPTNTQSDFINVLSAATLHRASATAPCLAVIASIRSDYLERCQTIESLKAVLDQNHYIHLFNLGQAEVGRMIREPARVVGLDVTEVENSLLEATTGNADSLPLLSMTLSALWDSRDTSMRQFTQAALADLGGLRGVIGRSADKAYTQWSSQYSDSQALEAFDTLFSALVQIDISGNPSRKSAALSNFETDEAVKRLIASLAGESCRLLSYANNHDQQPTVEVVHESLFRAWERLAEWIKQRQAQEGMLAHAEIQAQEWVNSQNKSIVRLELLRLHDAHRAMQALGKEPEALDEQTRQYLFPVEYLKSQIDQPIDVVSHKDRARIGELIDYAYINWSAMRDDRPGVSVSEDGLPNIDWDDYWVDVCGGSVIVELDDTDSDASSIESPSASRFKIAKYPVTQAQFKAFIAADDGYRNLKNWIPGKIPDPFNYLENGDNLPVANCHWYEAIAYCRWFDLKMRKKTNLSDALQVRLPTEWEWQLAASNGRAQDNYPWGKAWEEGRANTLEAQLSAMTAVGSYPLGQNDGGAFDLVGNCWEWMLNKKFGTDKWIAQQSDKQVQIDAMLNAMIFDKSDESRVLRGGSFNNGQHNARVGFRHGRAPHHRSTLISFRVCLSSPVKGY